MDPQLSAAISRLLQSRLTYPPDRELTKIALGVCGEAGVTLAVGKIGTFLSTLLELDGGNLYVDCSLFVQLFLLCVVKMSGEPGLDIREWTFRVGAADLIAYQLALVRSMTGALLPFAVYLEVAFTPDVIAKLRERTSETGVYLVPIGLVGEDVVYVGMSSANGICAGTLKEWEETQLAALRQDLGDEFPGCGWVYHRITPEEYGFAAAPAPPQNLIDGADA